MQRSRFEGSCYLYLRISPSPKMEKACASESMAAIYLSTGLHASEDRSCSTRPWQSHISCV